MFLKNFFKEGSASELLLLHYTNLISEEIPETTYSALEREFLKDSYRDKACLLYNRKLFMEKLRNFILHTYLTDIVTSYLQNTAYSL